MLTLANRPDVPTDPVSANGRAFLFWFLECPCIPKGRAGIRTTNPIESTFATVRHRTGKTKGCLSRKTGLAMSFKLMMSAQTKWRKLDGANRVPEIIERIEFKDGIKQPQNAT